MTLKADCCATCTALPNCTYAFWNYEGTVRECWCLPPLCTRCSQQLWYPHAGSIRRIRGKASSSPPSSTPTRQGISPSSFPARVRGSPAKGRLETLLLITDCVTMAYSRPNWGNGNGNWLFTQPAASLGPANNAIRSIGVRPRLPSPQYEKGSEELGRSKATKSASTTGTRRKASPGPN